MYFFIQTRTTDSAWYLTENNRYTQDMRKMSIFTEENLPNINEIRGYNCPPRVIKLSDKILDKLTT